MKSSVPRLVSSITSISIFALLCSSALSQAKVTLDKTSVPFGDAAINSKKDLKLTLTNSGDAALTYIRATISGSDKTDFSVSTTCKPLIPAKSTCDFTVTFSPTSSSAATASLEITDNASDTPQVIALSGSGSAPQTLSDVAKSYKSIQDSLSLVDDSDFALELGIGSLLRSQTTDYTNNSNVLAATSLGTATPQYLLGVAMRSRIPNFRGLGPKAGCDAADRLVKDQYSSDSAKATDAAQAKDCPVWRRRPWSGFLSLKFASNASESLNGYVLGGSYRAMHYMSLLLGFSLTPVNEPSYGLRNAASQYVTAQQKLGNLLSFDPTAMQNNAYNAFDGFSLLDTSGKLIYTGTPLETHYRGGVIIGVSIPINFSTFLKGN